jgi:hypothetical protein
VVRVGEDHVAAGGGEVVGRERLDRAHGAHGHERGREHVPVGRVETPRARAGGRVLGFEVEREGHQGSAPEDASGGIRDPGAGGPVALPGAANVQPITYGRRHRWVKKAGRARRRRVRTRGTRWRVLETRSPTKRCGHSRLRGVAACPVRGPGGERGSRPRAHRFLPGTSPQGLSRSPEGPGHAMRAPGPTSPRSGPCAASLVPPPTVGTP